MFQPLIERLKEKEAVVKRFREKEDVRQSSHYISCIGNLVYMCELEMLSECECHYEDGD